ncbi:F-box domain [Arabidopsis suecica]|uniref:F-box domain n=1 Tax=Arabidopsis suecica TaxID=45249 RepID=A0A8T2AGI3_ARASU|nr:F-box domain [Arabidopsis suecica]
MDRISGLSDELLVKVLRFLPTKEVVSTSILSKRWEVLWLWVPKLNFVMNHYESDLPIQDFITKNLLLLKAQVIESFHLQCFNSSFKPEDIKHWVETTISRRVRELIINYCDLSWLDKPVVLLAIPSSLYTCTSLVTLKLIGDTIIVDVPRTVCLPSLKTLKLDSVAYSSEDSLRLLLSYCPVLEDLTINRDRHDNVKTLVIIVPSLLRLNLPIDGAYSCDGYVIVTPSLKYFKVPGLYEEDFSYLIMHMPKVEEADLSVEQDVERLFESITSVKRLSLSVLLDIEDESMYHNGIYFNQLEHLNLHIYRDNWSKLLVRLLEDSLKLRVLKLVVEDDPSFDEEYEHTSWKYNDESSVPKCLLDSLEIFEFAGYTRRPEERDFVSYILKHACHLKSSSISHLSCYV